VTEAAQTHGIELDSTMAPLATMAPLSATLSEKLAEKLARYPGPAYRKAYLANLMASGNRLTEAGNARAAAYCFEKVGEALKDVADREAGEPDSESNDPSSNHPHASRPKAAQKAETPLEILRHQWRKDRLLDAEAVLRRQGGRLSSLENRIYRDKLDKLRSTAAAGENAGTQSQTTKVDATLLELRRQLYRRVLKSQKVSLRRKAFSGASLAQAFLLPGASSTAVSPTASPTSASLAGSGLAANPAASMDLPESPAQARPTGFQTIVGPYNDRYNLGDMLTLMAQADATWVEEFLDLYRGLADLKGLVTSLPAPARK